jgi:DNA-binding NarL/FixJ family response regulator
MKTKRYSVLIIDDHPLIIDAYKTAINLYSQQNEPISFSVKVAENCDSGLKLIHEFYKKEQDLSIIFLDIKLPPSKDKKILSGEDLGLKINTLLPETKIIVSTTYHDNYRIHSILKSLNPDGFLIKSDISPKELIDTIDTILNDPPYYSKTVIKHLRKQVVGGYFLDTIDRKILFELSIGTRMKDLPDILPLSIAGIEKRKRNLKRIFNVNSTDDKELFSIAKEKGFL